MFTYERAKEVFTAVNEYGIEKTSEKLKLSQSSIERYLRQLKQWNKVNDEVDVKILLFDIETAPSKAYIWNMWQENTNREKLIRDGFMLTYAAKWLNSDEIMVDALTFYDEYKVNPENDYHIVKSLYNLINSADIIIAHNGNKFDMKVLRTRLLYHDFKPLSQTKQIDTLIMARSLFKFPSNKLDSIGDYLGIGRKVHHDGFSLWRGCDEGNIDSWSKMIEYNEGDVDLLEKIYLKMRAWDKRHPNVAMFAKKGKRCTVCGSENITERNFASTAISLFESYQCDDCGHWNRGRKNIKTKQQMDNTLANVL